MSRTAHTSHRRLGRQMGFTLIELLLVVAVMLMLAAMSSPMYSRFITQNNTTTVADYFAAELRKAQSYAMVSRQGSAWGVNYAANTITLYSGISYGSRNSAFDEIYVVNQNIGVGITGASDINFARITGVPGVTSVINISGGSNAKTITVNAQGVVSR